MTVSPQPPTPEARPHTIHIHDLSIPDEYAWLQQRDDPALIPYLEAENAYAAAVMADTGALQQQLYAELRGRIKEQDLSVPVRDGPFLYYTRTETGQQYPLVCRRSHPDGPEELLLDVNQLAEGHSFCRLGPVEVSPDHTLLAYGLDTTGAIVYDLFVKDLGTGELLPDRATQMAWSLEWGEDGRTLYYTRFDHAHRPYRLYRHTLGATQADATLLYEEPDERYLVNLDKTRSAAYLLLTLYSHDGTEVHYKPAADPAAPFTLLDARRPKVEYKVTHQGDRFLIVTNEGAENFKLLAAPTADPAQRSELIAHRPDVLLDNVDAFAEHLVVYERRAGLQQIRISAPDGNNVRYVAFPEPVYSVSAEGNKAYATDTLRFAYSSLVTPRSIIDYGLDTAHWELRKQDEIPSGYDPSRYVAERLEAVAADGARVPISLVRLRDTPRDGTALCLLTGYGAYGYTYDPSFNANILSLTERGFVFAIAHIRGGRELGRAWYEQGRLGHKQNSFSDFIACAEALVTQGYTSPARLAITGTSAGGLLMSAVVNARPELFRAVLARVPFTNVVAAMLDPNLPLTMIEYDQWGNPHDPAQFRSLLSYSPYEHVAAKAYPHILATGGLNDLQVPYWDPAKWVARLRARKTDDNLLLLRINMTAGHSGASGRFASLEETAFEYAFLLKALGYSNPTQVVSRPPGG
ncbi:MAG: S9 family peptidase [Chloroflexales bacterium]